MIEETRSQNAFIRANGVTHVDNVGLRQNALDITFRR